MANKTRTDILAQIYQYMPQIEQTAKATLINNCIDLAVENISMQHNFRCFRATTPDAATLAANAYYLDLTDFTTMGGSTGYFKETIAMYRLRSGHDDHASMKFVDDIDFHNTYGYVDYSSSQTGAPMCYTYLNTRFLFDCRADQAYSIRVWYQTYHPPFASDATSHSFDSRDNMLAFQAIVYGALFELKTSFSTGEFPMDVSIITQMYQEYVSRLIQRDVQRTIANEDLEFGILERSTRRNSSSDPYDWV